MLLAHSLNKRTLNTPSRLFPPLPPPAPLYSSTFAKAPRSDWGEGREVRKWLWGFHLPGVVGDCFGFSFKKELPSL